MKFNCDMGESFGSWAKGNDEAVMPFVDMANIACGMHASDPTTMARTVQLACRFDVSIGAHPGYPDLLGFGRRELTLEAEELEACVLYQIGALDGICRAQGRRVEYVKPHGALYNRMMRDQATLDSMIAAVRRYDAGLPLVVLGAGESANAALRERAAGQGVELWFEAFADRAYDARGRLVPRSEPGAVHTDVDRVLRQVKEIAEQGQVSTLDGGTIPLQADTLCLHGDNEQLLAAVGRIRAALS
ncbi:5-oxoprolinase subunit PxpA [Marinobacterium sedimentorum]|uniref:5-oxoprolinase subunit PxpA n=1 Tax=Marinobacterium sedimentorum TaxID=2927804 RepID=UPI0020C5FC06|nr:5-oxoprolinase subunit PxpA [Marinobacterium sedimentorum]